MEELIEEYIKGLERIMEENGKNEPVDPNIALYSGKSVEEEIRLAKERLEHHRNQQKL